MWARTTYHRKKSPKTGEVSSGGKKTQRGCKSYLHINEGYNGNKDSDSQVVPQELALGQKGGNQRRQPSVLRRKSLGPFRAA